MRPGSGSPLTTGCGTVCIQSVTGEPARGGDLSAGVSIEAHPQLSNVFARSQPCDKHGGSLLNSHTPGLHEAGTRKGQLSGGEG